MRSTLGRARVTHTVRPLLSRLGSDDSGTIGIPALAQPTAPPSSASASAPALRSHAAAPWLSLCPSRHTTTTLCPMNSSAHSEALTAGRRKAPGIRRASAAKSSSVRTSTIVGALARPTRRTSFSTEMLFKLGMRRPDLVLDAILQHVASWGDRYPHQAIKQTLQAGVNSLSLTAACTREHGRRVLVDVVPGDQLDAFEIVLLDWACHGVGRAFRGKHSVGQTAFGRRAGSLAASGSALCRLGVGPRFILPRPVLARWTDRRGEAAAV